jgi:hypothetical protein
LNAYSEFLDAESAITIVSIGFAGVVSGRGRVVVSASPSGRGWTVVSWTSDWSDSLDMLNLFFRFEIERLILIYLNALLTLWVGMKAMFVGVSRYSNRCGEIDRA